MAKEQKKSAGEMRQEISNIANDIANVADQAETLIEEDTFGRFIRMCDLLKFHARKYHELQGRSDG